MASTTPHQRDAAPSTTRRRWARVAGVGLPALFVLIWSSGYLVGDIGATAASPEALLFWRFALASVVLGVIALATRAPWPRRPSTWLHLLVTGVLLQTVQFGGVYIGLSLGVSAGLTSLVVSAAPIVIAALAVPLFREHLRKRQVIGLLIGLAGVGVAVSTQLSASGSIGGFVAVLFGLVGFAGGALYQKRFGQEMDLRTGTLIQLLGATVSTVPLALATGGLGIPLTGAAIGSTLWLALINSIGGFTLLFLLLRRSTGGSATSYMFLVPPVTALIAVPLLGQPVQAATFAGILLAAVGVAMVTWFVGGRKAEPGRAALDPATGSSSVTGGRTQC